ncbi:SDR family NAD(P)-dependent oxidoreductase [Gimesia aquarii]|uniref:3-oxoacyl-[acyl-carrier-protein] reductase FabG n=1 Tax=Gimesia aquarii TaxID=2527964 RepID=A0A517VZM1_9PLAN|nr:SDR family oxidoreductase [Gimesia aquarii]QDT98454.1 3-oxoacyl-[acyl-carrier-protein] reductase FabG [Gimesia aquarii]
MNDSMSRFSVKGKTALVTGASRGIGAEIAMNLAQAGAEVLITARHHDDLIQVCEKIRSIGSRCEAIEADLISINGVEEVAQKAFEFFSTIDILVNNAGTIEVAPFWETTVEDWDQMQAVNLRAPFILSKILSEPMRAQKQGKIINISSVAGIAALAGHAAYSASKGGLNQLTKVMAAELGPFNIQCNAVAPTVILTELGQKVWGSPEKGEPMKDKIPLHRFGKPLEVADLVLYLASPASDMMTGQVIALDGGYTAL